MTAPQLTPVFFGAGDHQLFGIYHAPTGAMIRDAGVVLCYPSPQEYSQMHWAFQKLAVMLADAGLHVLRFDYFGTGDSFGGESDGTLAQWTEDVALAAQELRDLSGVRRISLVGMRVGAALAMRASASGLRVRDLVLWDPVVRGVPYVSHLDDVEGYRLRLLRYPEPDERVAGELLGHAFTDRMRTDTCAIDLLTEPFGRVDRLLIVAPTLTDDQLALHRRAESEGLHATASAVADPTLYIGRASTSDTVLSHAVPIAITAFLSRSGG